MKKGRLSVSPLLKPGVGDLPGGQTKEMCAELVAASQEALFISIAGITSTFTGSIFP